MSEILFGCCALLPILNYRNWLNYYHKLPQAANQVKHKYQLNFLYNKILFLHFPRII